MGGRLVALISIQDRLRPKVLATLAALKNFGLDRVVMLIGDIEATATARAREIGLEESQLLPDQKAAFVISTGSAFLRSKGLHIYSGILLAGVTLSPIYKYRHRLAAHFRILAEK